MVVAAPHSPMHKVFMRYPVFPAIEQLRGIRTIKVGAHVWTNIVNEMGSDYVRKHAIFVATKTIPPRGFFSVCFRTNQEAIGAFKLFPFRQIGGTRPLYLLSSGPMRRRRTSHPRQCRTILIQIDLCWIKPACGCWGVRG